MAETEKEPKRLLMRMKEENEKIGLKHNIQKIKITASRRGRVVVTDFIFWTPKSLLMVTAAVKLQDTCFLEGKL